MLTNKGDTEKRIQCPYDPSHVLLHYRMQPHLVKCRRNHPATQMVSCLFNSTHQVPEPEIPYHYEVCADRGNLEKFTHTTEVTNPNRFPIQQVDVTPQEMWDDVPDHPTYDPEEYCRNNPILRNTIIQTRSAAQRRTFRLEERQRMQELENQRCENENQGRKVQQRRPVGASEGMQNRAELVDNDLFDVANLLAKVDLGSNTLTTPRMSAATTAQDENSSNNDHERDIVNKVPTNSTWAVPRTQSAGLNGNETQVPNRSTGTVPRTQDAAFNGNVNQVPSRSTGAVPRVANRFSHAEDFPQLGAPRSLSAHNAANFPSRPVSHGRGSGLAKK